MSTLTEGLRGINHLLNHSTYTNGVHSRPNHQLSSHHHADVMSQHQSNSQPQQQPNGGRQLRSSQRNRQGKEPDWDEFFKNGRPKEIIVIDDTPEPGPSQSQTLSGHSNQAVHEAGTGSATKKRKYDDTSTYSRYQGSAGGSGSSHNEREAATPGLARNDSSSQPGTKRKRVNAPSTHSSVKRREVTIKANEIEYLGLTTWSKKSSPVPVRLIRDDPKRDKNLKIDDDDGHYIVVPDTNLANRYRITRLLGQGTFGKVVQAVDRVNNQAVAVKVIRAVQKYRDAAKIELRALQTLRDHDAENRYRCIHLRDCFDFRNHICIVTDLLDLSLFDFLKGNSFVPFPNSHIQSFAKSLFTSVAFLHDLTLIHTDLKPENILLKDASYQTFTYSRKVPSSQAGTTKPVSQRRVLLDPEIRLIDFGSATYQDEYHSSVVSTRHYRAPEIIMGLGWSYPCDIWSIGCILVEFYTGDALFQTHDNLEHLAMMEAVVDKRIDAHLIRQAKALNTPGAKLFKRGKLDYPNNDVTRASRRFVKGMKKLTDIIHGENNPFLQQFIDLLQKIFVYDPAQRITAKEALKHPWFKMSHRDDGTEAARIQMERKLEDARRRADRGSGSSPFNMFG